LEVSLQIPDLPRNRVLSAKSSAGVNARLDEATKRGWITQEQCTALKELWERRNNVHLKLLENSERDLYKVEHVNVPHAALLVLMSKLKSWHADGQPD
jgi:hypothetical protein